MARQQGIPHLKNEQVRHALLLTLARTLPAHEDQNKMVSVEASWLQVCMLKGGTEGKEYIATVIIDTVFSFITVA